MKKIPSVQFNRRFPLAKYVKKPYNVFYSKSSKKVPMKALEGISLKHEARQANDALLDLDFFTNKLDGDIVNGQNTNSTLYAEDSQPRRPQSGYAMWLEDAKQNVKAEHPRYSANEVAKVCEETWRAMEAAERGVSLNNIMHRKSTFYVMIHFYGVF